MIPLGDGACEPFHRTRLNLEIQHPRVSPGQTRQHLRILITSSLSCICVARQVVNRHNECCRATQKMYEGAILQLHTFFGHDLSGIPVHSPVAGPIQTGSTKSGNGDKYGVADRPRKMEEMSRGPISRRVTQGLQFDFIGGLRASPTIQRKPTVSSPGDRFEQEADDVAEKVMRMTGPARAALPHAAIQCKCAECEDDEKKLIQPKPGPSAHTGGRLDVVGAVVRMASRGGTPLSGDTRSHFEPRFGCDFSRVRVHTDGEAADAERVVRARAYTIGQHVVFGNGEYAPATVEGRRLLAHELVHVVQQTGNAWSREPKDAGKKMGSEPQVKRKRQSASATRQRRKHVISKPIAEGR